MLDRRNQLCLPLVLIACAEEKPVAPAAVVANTVVTEHAPAQLTDKQLENIVRRSYQYVAVYNVTNKFAMDPSNPGSTGGWNRLKANTTLLDHTVKAIARPNNDTFYITMMLDLRNDPVIISLPEFDSSYVSLMVTGYDHYVTVPLSVSKGDFQKPEKVLFYSARTKNYGGEAVDGVDRIIETTGDFVSAVVRVMPHANDQARFDKIMGQIQAVGLVTLAEYQGEPIKPLDDPGFPAYGQTDMDVYGDNFLAVMQFVVNHSTFDADDELDVAFLAALKPLGVEPAQAYGPAVENSLDTKRLREAAEKIYAETFVIGQDPATMKKYGADLFGLKGEIPLNALLIQSVVGPLGLPMTEAIYQPVLTTSGETMNAMNDYVIRMSAGELPPANAFWSLTLYDSENGFFIPNDQRKYSVGENAGMQLKAEGGIDIHVAAQQPEGVPAENWLPVTRQDEALDMIVRIYSPDLERFSTWTRPQAELVE